MGIIHTSTHTAFSEVIFNETFSLICLDVKIILGRIFPPFQQVFDMTGKATGGGLVCASQCDCSYLYEVVLPTFLNGQSSNCSGQVF